MSITVSRGEGLTVLTVSSNPGSKWPIICQILGTMCYSPVCSVSEGLKKQFRGPHKALATVQIMVGLINIAFGGLYQSTDTFDFLTGAPFWMGGVFVAAGIMYIFVDRFPSPCLVFLNLIINLVSAAIALTAIVMYSVNLGTARWTRSSCEHDYGYGYGTQSPEAALQNMEKCVEYRDTLKVFLEGLEIFLIVLAVLQLFVAVGCSSLNLKALCNNKGDEEHEKDPTLHEPLLEEVTSNPAS
ncbi:transmembrane protein 176B [Chanos chanos]|uniref:Transmembrane protein 176B n=1 Tax=Chanos chanos TaxID=29144 RepID=A0A6J2VW74_CHACN|nr:transmembrane protein 176B [Chanos chanos]